MLAFHTTIDSFLYACMHKPENCNIPCALRCRSLKRSRVCVSVCSLCCMRAECVYVCVCVELLKRSKTWTSTSPVKDFYMVFDFWYLAFGIWNHVLDLCSWILLAFGIWHMCSYQQRGKASSDDLA